MNNYDMKTLRDLSSQAWGPLSHSLNSIPETLRPEPLCPEGGIFVSVRTLGLEKIRRKPALIMEAFCIILVIRNSRKGFFQELFNQYITYIIMPEGNFACSKPAPRGNFTWLEVHYEYYIGRTLIHTFLINGIPFCEIIWTVDMRLTGFKT